jgi:ABC-type antimicrobial peptide transport system permease subunit
MWTNYFKTAWRSLLKGRLHTLINITGLSIGMAVTLLIGLWIWSELSFDRNFDHYDRIAQVMQTETLNGNTTTGKGNGIPLAATLRTEYSNDFQAVVLSSWTLNCMINGNDKTLNTQGNFMEPGAPELLSLKMISGSRQAFHAKSTILLSQSTATALFGERNPLGQTIVIGGDLNETVAGIYKDFPENSSFKDVAFIAPFLDLSSWVDGNEDNWDNESFQVFVQLAKNAQLKAVSSKISHLKRDHLGPLTAKRANPRLFLHPMQKWHLYGEFKDGVNTGGAIRYVWMFAIIGLFVLLLACINFMNLSTARSEKRAREVGIRKAIGSLRGQLINQFFSESLLTTFLAFGISVAMVIVALPFFNAVAGKQISLPWGSLYFWLACIGFCVFTGLLAGVYPALYLSAVSPIKVLKGTFKAGRHASVPRKVLVVVQFTVSVILIVATLTVFRQVQFARSRPVGYSNQGLITMIMRTTNFHDHFNSMRNDLLQTGAVTDIAESNSPVTENDHFSDGFTWEGAESSNARFNTINVTAEYGKTVGLSFVAGRDFSHQLNADSNAILINQKAAQYIGFKEPVGQIIRQSGNAYVIVGVVKDMITQSPYDPVEPTIYFLNRSLGGILNIRLNPNQPTAASLAEIAAVCKKYSPEEPFDYEFADQTYAHKFADEIRVGQLAAVFASLAMLISCLGILGMAAFMAEQRRKEIGIRKVLGASLLTLWGLLSKEFILFVIVSCGIAIPVAYYFMHQWLQNYAYRAPLSWWIFALACLSALVVTLITVSYQSVRASLENPIKSLRTE